MAMAIVILACIVLFFCALIIPKGKKKIIWILVWFAVFFGYYIIFSAINSYYISKYAGIEIIEKPIERRYYGGKVDEYTYATYNWNFKNLINGYVDFIDLTDNNWNFRFYLDDNNSVDCFITDKNKLNLPNKCIARKTITEISNYVIENCDNNYLCAKLNNFDIGYFGKIIGIKFNNEIIIKNSKTNDILATNKGSYCTYKDSILNSWFFKILAFEVHANENSVFASYCYADKNLDCETTLIKTFFSK